MILPIKLTDQLGLPGGGVPAFAMDPSTGDIIGASSFPAAASGIDPVTGEPMTTDSAAAYSNDSSLWPAGSTSSGNVTNPAILNVNSTRDTRGTQWERTGTYQSESGFDKWRRMGRPTSCRRSMGDWAGTIQQALTAGIVGADAANLPAGSVVQSGPNGITISTPGNYGTTVPYVPGQAITATASANPLGWILGLGLVGFLFYTVSRR